MDEVDNLREWARERIAGRSMMLIDGDPIGALARAHERHAERLEAALGDVRSVGIANGLGETSEGRTATRNYRQSAVDGESSFTTAVTAQAEASRRIAERLRETRASLQGQDSDGAVTINPVRT